MSKTEEYKSKIIAEIGVNWNNDIFTAQDMIFQSKRAGADYVKFQMYNEEIVKDSKHKKELSEMILCRKRIDYLSKQAKHLGIGFGLSVMYPEGFTMLEEINFQQNYNPVDFIKIRCSDCSNEKIARPAVKYCDKYEIPLLISTEVPRYEDDYFRYNLYNTKNAKYLYCVPEYPPELKEIRDYLINNEDFNGYSNHYQSKYLPMIAVSRCLEWVETHVKRETTNEQIDEKVSISFDDLKEVCDFNHTLSQLT